MRSSMLEVLRQDYVRTAKAKGLARLARPLQARPAQRAHPDRHPARPDDPDPARRRGVTETIFSWPGLGFLGVRRSHDATTRSCSRSS